MEHTETYPLTLSCLQADYANKSTLRQLLELYKYDFTAYDPEDVNESGLYEYRDLDSYWNVPGHYPFLLRADGKLAGFALIRRFEADSGSGHEMVEFFVLKKYRGYGLGRAAAQRLFAAFPGAWKLSVMENNAPALAFWQRAIFSCPAASDHIERREEDWEGPVLQFEVCKSDAPPNK
ncbi:GNAT family N-acetyltransferase [Saccharibacillus sacchari]|uniref:GNAT family N-acetyltransferase n=1 Tax=Saccharibacillus sacchari TaxID=456493 RepID=A0ACC6PKM2_9BACL